jgi:hypothetical protein
LGVTNAPGLDWQTLQSTENISIKTNANERTRMSKSSTRSNFPLPGCVPTLIATDTAFDGLLSVITVNQQKQRLSAMAQLFVAQE